MLFPPAGAPQPLRAVAYALSYPGYLIALAFAGGRVDDINFFVLSLANVAIYWMVGYFIIALVDRLTHKNINRAT